MRADKDNDKISLQLIQRKFRDSGPVDPRPGHLDGGASVTLLGFKGPQSRGDIWLLDNCPTLSLTSRTGIGSQEAWHMKSQSSYWLLSGDVTKTLRLTLCCSKRCEKALGLWPCFLGVDNRAANSVSLVAVP